MTCAGCKERPVEWPQPGPQFCFECLPVPEEPTWMERAYRALMSILNPFYER